MKKVLKSTKLVQILMKGYMSYQLKPQKLKIQAFTSPDILDNSQPSRSLWIARADLYSQQQEHIIVGNIFTSSTHSIISAKVPLFTRSSEKRRPKNWSRQHITGSTALLLRPSDYVLHLFIYYGCNAQRSKGFLNLSIIIEKQLYKEN